jgi:hypothetical protein
MASGPRCQHHQSLDTRALVVIVVIASCSSRHVALYRSAVAWVDGHGGGRVVSCHVTVAAGVSVMSWQRQQQQSCHVMVAAWHGGWGHMA